MKSCIDFEDRFDFKVSLSLGLRFYSYLTYPFLHFSFIFWLKIFKILMRAFNLSITLKLILIFIVILFVCLDVCFFVCIRKTPKLQNRWGLVFFVGPHLTTEKGYEWLNFKKIDSNKIRILKILKINEIFFLNPRNNWFVFLLQCIQGENVHNWKRRWARSALQA